MSAESLGPDTILAFDCPTCKQRIEVALPDVVEMVSCPACKGGVLLPELALHLKRQFCTVEVHPVFGELRPNSSGWQTTVTLPCGRAGDLPAEIWFEKKPGKTAETNFILVRERWPEIWGQMEAWLARWMPKYGYADRLDGHFKKLEVSLPTGRFGKKAEWGVTAYFEPFAGYWSAEFHGLTLIEKESQPMF